VSDLDAIVLGNGPGSFIGMRIGAAVAQGLCYGANLPIIPVSSLAAVAAEVFTDHDGERVVVVQDARMHEVYCCTYHRGKDGLPAAEMDERILPVGPLPLREGSYLGAGAAWKRYPELAAANAGSVTDIVPVDCPRARVLLSLAAAAGKPIPAETLVPAYLRSKVADEP
jgi:tRNA threonylcarbamoyladenosine biosynthesis protein TsaB